ncbi:MAG: HD domain-containing protein [Chloroflexi bacterium]|nr:HD domain-containing protein [Chloroflexota bacterium]
MAQQARVLVVTGETELPILAAQLEAAGFAVRRASTGAEALAVAAREQPHAVVASALLPDRDGFTVCWELKSDPLLRGIPVVLLDEREALKQDRPFGKQLGASAVLDRSAPEKVARAIRTAIACRDHCVQSPRLDEVTFLRENNRRLAGTLANHQRQAEVAAYRLRSYANHLHEANFHLQEAYLATLEALAGALDVRDAYTHSHSRAVAHYAVAIGRELDLPPEDLESLHWAGLLHDIGKIGIPDAVLRKAGKPTEDEWRVIKTHPDVGHRLLSPLKFLRRALPAVRHHQERFDGRGYPSGLRASAIPLLARVVAVADAFHAMTSQRPYRLAMTTEQAIDGLRRGRGTQFDPTIVDACLRALTREAMAGPPPSPGRLLVDRSENVH